MTLRYWFSTGAWEDFCLWADQASVLIRKSGLQRWAKYEWDCWVERMWESPRGQWLCGQRGHADVWWYSSGYAPDMHCKRCGLDIG